MAYSVALNTGVVASQNEGAPGAAGSWTLKLTRDVDLLETSYSFHVFNGTDPNPSDDFAGGADQTFTWAANQTDLLLVLTAANDIVVENDETPIIWFYKGGTPAGSPITTFNGITIKNDDFVPSITSASFSAAENGTAVGTVAATSGGPILYAISGGADAGKFSIDANTGVLTFVAPKNFEAPDDANSDKVYELQVQASTGAVATKNITVTLTNVNEAITVTGGAGPVASSVNEGLRAVATVAATDIDANDTVAWSISGGTDASKFTINTAGELSFVTAPDFEAPTDSDLNNIYNVIVRATDSGGLFSDQTRNVTVNDILDPAVISSYSGADQLFLHASENTATTVALATVAASVQFPAATVTYSIVGGADAASFNVNATTGVLTFAQVKDFEAPGSVNGDNFYRVTVRATPSTGGAADDQQFNIFLDDVPNDNGGGGGIVTPPIPPAPTPTPTPTPPPAPPPTPGATSGDDSILGGSTGDVRSGGAGSDTIDGGAGDDSLDGDGGNDSLLGGDGSDFIRGLDDNDTVMGGEGADTVNGNKGQDSVDGGAGADFVYGGQGDDTVYGGDGDDPYVNGNIGNDIVHGGAGNDSVYGGQNDDIIYGDGGDDLLSGDLGNDLMYGGDGADRFTIAPGGGSDWVIDFNGAAGDRIQLAPGTAYSIGSYQGQVLITVGGTATIGLAGVSAFDPSWVVFG